MTESVKFRYREHSDACSADAMGLLARGQQDPMGELLLFPASCFSGSPGVWGRGVVLSSRLNTYLDMACKVQLRKGARPPNLKR